MICSNEHSFGLDNVQVQFVLSHPVLDISETGSCSFHEGRDVLWFRAALELLVISVEMVVEATLFDDVGERRGVVSDEDWSLD